MIKYLIIIFILFISGCSLSIQDSEKSKKTYTKKEYEIIKQRESFIRKSNAFLSHTMSKNIDSNYINLPTVSKQMIFIIPTAELLDTVHYVINSENDKINIKYHLISGLEYFYDKVNHELLIIYNLPFSYFLDSSLIYNLEIIGSLDGEIVEKNIIFDWTYNFMAKAKYFNKSTYNPSFEKIKANDKNLDDRIKNILEQESKQINIKRFSDNYKRLYKKVISK